MNAFEIASGILGLGANIVLALAYFFNLRKINRVFLKFTYLCRESYLLVLHRKTLK